MEPAPKGRKMTVTHRDGVFSQATEPVVLQFRKFFISNEFVEEELGTNELSDNVGFLYGYTHHEGDRHEDIGTDFLWEV